MKNIIINIFSLLFIGSITLLTSCKQYDTKSKDEIIQMESDTTVNEEILITEYCKHLSSRQDIDLLFAEGIVFKLINKELYTESRYCIDNLILNGYSSPMLINYRGLCYLNEMRYKLAINDFREVLRENSDNSIVNNNVLVAEIYLRILKEIQTLDTMPSTVNKFIERANKFTRLKKPKEGIYDYKNVLKIDSTNVKACTQLSISYLYLHNYYSAAVYFQKAYNINKDKDNYILYKYALDVVEVDKMIVQTPNNSKLYLKKSRAQAFFKQYTEAHKTLDQGIVSCTNNRELKIIKMFLYVQNNEKDKAISYLDKLEAEGVKVDRNKIENLIKR